MSAVAVEIRPGREAGFSGRAGFVLACAGSAIGLGNLWKFPYIVGEHGGGAFVLVYLLCVAAVGLPILLAELVAGRLGGPDPLQALPALSAGRRSPWRFAGGLMLLSAVGVLALYSAVAGWAVAYAGQGLQGAFSRPGLSAEVRFQALLADPATLLACHTLFLGATALVVAGGIRKGIERHLRWMMPLLLLMLVGLFAYAALGSGQMARTVDYLLRPRWETLGAEAVAEAIGHAFYSLSVGLGGMLAYGAYSGERVPMARVALTVAAMDTGTALLAAFAIFPLVFAAGLDPAAGPGLLFVSLPTAFVSLPGGGVLGTLFFVLVVLAALTSAVSVLEPIGNACARRFGLGRVPAVWLCATGLWTLGLACVFGPNLWSELRAFGLPLLDLFDTVASGLLLPLSAAAVALAVGWSVRRDRLLFALPDMPAPLRRAWRWSLRGLAPGAVLAVLAWRWW